MTEQDCVSRFAVLDVSSWMTDWESFLTVTPASSHSGSHIPQQMDHCFPPLLVVFSDLLFWWKVEEGNWATYYLFESGLQASFLSNPMLSFLICKIGLMSTFSHCCSECKNVNYKPVCLRCLAHAQYCRQTGSNNLRSLWWSTGLKQNEIL